MQSSLNRLDIQAKYSAIEDKDIKDRRLRVDRLHRMIYTRKQAEKNMKVMMKMVMMVVMKR